MSKVDDDCGTVIEEPTEDLGIGSKKGKEIVLFQSDQVNDGSDSNFAKSLAKHRPSSSSSKHSPVETFAVQCSQCLKWRLIPSKERYEEIRENILEVRFNCVTARDWKDGVSCDDPGDIHPDESRVWAIDKPNIARTPPGWERLITIRAAGSTRFADVYYLTPKGKKLRSLNETQKHLEEHPEYGVIISQFSFQTPRPLQEDYVRKRPQSRAPPYSSMGQATFENDDAQPVSWAIPRCTDLSLCTPQFSGSYYQESNGPRKKQKIKSLKKKGYGKVDNSQNHPPATNYFMYEM